MNMIIVYLNLKNKVHHQQIKLIVFYIYKKRTWWKQGYEANMNLKKDNRMIMEELLNEVKKNQGSIMPRVNHEW